MKLKIMNIKPNPYRRLEQIPLSEEKVLALEASIKQTGFWDNIVVRKHHGEYQLAYGHHRLEALKRIFPPDHVVDVPVKKLDDATMIKIMANENMADWSPSPAVIDHTVKVTREYLIAYPEIAKKYGQVHKSSQTGENLIGAVLIANFLNWKQTKISDSLERLNIISSGTITQLTIECFDTEGSARTFVQKIKEQEKAGKPIPNEKHQEIAKKFKASGNSKKVLDEAVNEALVEKTPEVESQDIKLSSTGSSIAPVTETVETSIYQDIINEFNESERRFQNAIQKIHAYYGESGTIPEECKTYQTSVHAKLIIIRNTIASLIERLGGCPS